MKQVDIKMPRELLQETRYSRNKWIDRLRPALRYTSNMGSVTSDSGQPIASMTEITIKPKPTTKEKK